MNQTSKLLDSIDWDFQGESGEAGIHSIHSYPARFIPQIPRNLVRLFHPSDSSIVLDPFCGCGTALVEAIDLGLDAFGIDVNPLACLIAEVKTKPLPLEFLEVAKRVTYEAKEQLSKGVVTVPPIPRLSHWFKPVVQKALAVLIDQINKEEKTSLRDALRVALSSIIVQVSNQESDTRYAAVDKRVSAQDVFSKFEKVALTIGQAIFSFWNNLSRYSGKRLGRAMVLNRDILTVTPDDLPSDIGLVVTSPPYPNAYEYWLYHKYRMYWLGMDPISTREREIGARCHYFKSKPQDERDFEQQMNVVFHLLAQSMKLGAKACFLIGRSIIHGRLVDNLALLRRLAGSQGFSEEGIIERRIPARRKSFNPAHGNINKEHLIVFKLETRP